MKATKIRTMALLFHFAITLAGSSTAFGQSVPPHSSMKTIGTPTAAAKPEIVPSLFVLNSRGAPL